MDQKTKLKYNLNIDMNIQIEFIRGFVVGIDYVDDIEIPEHDRTVELIRISLGIVWINFFIFNNA